MKLNKSIYKDYKKYPERVVQFGEGNFLRAFVDWMIDKMNKELDYNTGVLIIQPRNKDTVYRLNEQDGLYTLLLNGIEKGQIVEKKEIINCISRGINTYKEFDTYLKAAEDPNIRFIVSNTTEAGIVYEETDRFEDTPPESFPGKLTRFLYHRFKTFNGDASKGLLILPCELIDNNGDTLKEIVLKLAENWGLEEDFAQWVEDANIFYNTLVDRIVTGYPKDNIDDLEKELGYEDDFLVQGEIFHLWVIEGPDQIKEEFPADKLGLNVLFVDDLTPYRERKVRILNGAHTSMVPVSYLYGLETVRESIEDEVVGKFIKSAIYDEIIPTLDLREEELLEFADAVVDRFKNPFINHYLMDISLNSMSKFKTRVLPSLLEYNKRKDTLPEKLVFSLAALIYFYKGERMGEIINLSDDKEILTFYKEIWNEYNGTQESIETIVEEVLGLESLWEEDLNNIVGLKEKTVDYLGKIIDKGMEETLKEMV